MEKFRQSVKVYLYTEKNDSYFMIFSLFFFLMGTNNPKEEKMCFF